MLALGVLFLLLATSFASGYVFEKFLTRHAPLTMNTEDITETDSFTRITDCYLYNKLNLGGLKDDPLKMDKVKLQQMIRSLLPPVTQAELDKEVDALVRHLQGSQTKSITSILAENSYWKEAGSLVVMELIFLDCVHAYYFEKRKILADEDYSELMDLLSWEGSMVASLKGNEAHFITAVTAAKRGMPIISDDEYEKLKAELQAEGSWVVKRVLDPLEKLGVDTYLSYLHRSL